MTAATTVDCITISADEYHANRRRYDDDYPGLEQFSWNTYHWCEDMADDQEGGTSRCQHVCGGRYDEGLCADPQPHDCEGVPCDHYRGVCDCEPIGDWQDVIRDDLDCRQCGQKSELLECGDCGVEARMTTCEHFDSPRPIDGYDHHTLCDACFEARQRGWELDDGNWCRELVGEGACIELTISGYFTEDYRVKIAGYRWGIYQSHRVGDGDWCEVASGEGVTLNQARRAADLMIDRLGPTEAPRHWWSYVC